MKSKQCSHNLQIKAIEAIVSGFVKCALADPLEPSVRYIGQQSYLHLLQPAVFLVLVTRPQMANLAKTDK